MAERKSGPLKPPVIDLTARDVGVPVAEPVAPPQPAAMDAETPEAPEMPRPQPRPESVSEPRPEPPRPAPPMPPRPSAKLAMPWSAVGVAAAGGAVLGTVLTYLFANLVALPDHRPQIADPAAVLASQETRLDEFGTRLDAVEAQSRRTQISLDATLTQLDSGFAEVKQSLAALPVPAAPTDIAPIEARLTSLEGRIDAIGAGASPSEASGLTETIAGLDAGIAELKQQLADLSGRVTAQAADVAAARSDVTAAKAAIAAQNQTLGGAQIAPAVRLPLVVTGLESAFAAGRPYTVELDSLVTLLPDLTVPDSVRNGAAAGLPRPDAVAAEFSALVPTVLAGRAGSGSGDIGQDALDWMKGLLAFRPAGEIDGTTPEAIVSRLEAAVGRRDFLAAATELAALPEPMQAAAGAAGADIKALAEAEGFVAGVRAAALKPGSTEPAT